MSREAIKIIFVMALMVVAVFVINKIAHASIYETTIIKATLVRPTETRTIAVETGTVKDPETGLLVPVYTDQQITEPIKDAPLELDIPFTSYGQNIISSGKKVDLNDLKNEGMTVIAKVDYRVEDHPSGAERAKSEKVVAEKYAGNIGKEWAVIKDNVDVKLHVLETKEDALATFDENNIKVLYDGTDKLELQRPFQWVELVKVIDDPIIIKDPIVKETLIPIVR